MPPAPIGDHGRDIRRRGFRAHPDGVLHHPGLGPAVGHDAHPTDAEERRPPELLVVELMAEAVDARPQRQHGNGATGPRRRSPRMERKIYEVKPSVSLSTTLPTNPSQTTTSAGWLASS